MTSTTRKKISIITIGGIAAALIACMALLGKAQDMAYGTMRPVVERTCDTVVHEHLDVIKTEIDSVKCKQGKYEYNQEYMIELLKQMATSDQKVKAQNAMSEYKK
jgi:hypothetical protein